MNEYSFAVNQTKLNRAISTLKKYNELNPLAPKPINEETVKAEYVKLAGLLLEDAPKEVQEHIEKEEIEKEVKKIVAERKAKAKAKK